MEPNSPRPTVIPPQTAPAAPVKAGLHNYAGAIFFILLIIGFTFSIPAFIKIPLIFFAIAAGLMFFKDASKPTQQAVSLQPSMLAPEGWELKKKPSTFMRVLKIILIVLLVPVILYVGFIILLILALSSGGGF